MRQQRVVVGEKGRALTVLRDMRAAAPLTKG
jgi:hypothetical protein